jgi:hypothetical protein
MIRINVLVQLITVSSAKFAVVESGEVGRSAVYSL